VCSSRRERRQIVEVVSETAWVDPKTAWVDPGTPSVAPGTAWVNPGTPSVTPETASVGSEQPFTRGHQKRPRWRGLFRRKNIVCGASARSWSRETVLVSFDLEITFGRAVIPAAGNCAVV
jgi:hypothetical protein